MNSASNVALKNALRPLEPYLELIGTNEVIVNRENEVVLETASGWEFVPDKNITKEMFLSVGRILANRAGTDFDAHPYLGAELPDGHRLHLCMGTTVESGLCAAIRLKRSRKLTIDNFLTEKSFAPKPEMSFDFDDNSEQSETACCGKAEHSDFWRDQFGQDEPLKRVVEVCA